MLLADDMGAWAMRCAGNEDVITDNIDRLASSGMRFDDFFCVSPVCSPARASILTGTIPSVHGVHDWLRSGNLDKDKLGSLADDIYYKDEKEAIRYLDQHECYSDLLASAGYSCALSGKWHLGDSRHPQHGFTRWFTIGRGGCGYYRADIVDGEDLYISDRYITDTITDKALEFLEELSSEENPFYLSVHYTAPHSPWDEDQHPSGIYSMYEGCSFSSTPDLPLNRHQVKSAPYGEGAERRRLLRGYYSAITAMDIGIGKILDFLEKRGMLENTIVIFSGDNGMNMGHHGIWGKGNGTFPLNMYDTSVKVPMIISWKDHIAPGVSHAMLSHYDLFPTILEIAGINDENAARKPGKSFLPVLYGNEMPDREVVVFDEYGPTRMIRTPEAKLVYRYPYGPHELYDLAADPDENHDLYHDSRYVDLRERLLCRLEEWFFEYADPAVDGTREGVTGFGQLSRAGIARKGTDSYCPILDELFV